MSTFYYIYYVEINLFCIALFLIMVKRVRELEYETVAYRKLWKAMLILGIFLSASDMGGALVRGQTFMGARFLVYFFNSLFVAGGCGIAFVWYLMVREKVNEISPEPRWLHILFYLPVLADFIICGTTAWTGWFFTVDENNLYVRGSLAWLQWALVGIYLIFPTIRLAIMAMKEKRRTVRRSAIIIAAFPVCFIIAFAIQVCFYGVTCIQVGYVISALISSMYFQHEHITRDGITGLNNRRSFDKYIENELNSYGKSETMCLMMIDIEDFKQINEEYGHIESDMVLRMVGDAIEKATEYEAGKLFVARYGGDEFCIVATKRENYPFLREELVDRINNILREKTEGNPTEYDIKINITGVCGLKSDFATPENIIKMADEKLYGTKFGTKI